MVVDNRKPRIPRRTQTTYAGAPQVAGRQPYAPTKPLGATPIPGPSLSTVPGPPAPTTQTRIKVPGGWIRPSAPAPTPPPASVKPPIPSGFTPGSVPPAALTPTGESRSTQTLGGLQEKSDFWKQRKLMALDEYFGMDQLIQDMQKGQFDDLRRSFTESISLSRGAEEQRQQAALEREAGRRGLTGSGLEAQAMTQIRLAGSAQASQSFADFEGKLLAVQQAERERLRTNTMDFILGVNKSMTDLNFQQGMGKIALAMQKDEGGFWSKLASSYTQSAFKVGESLSASQGVPA